MNKYIIKVCVDESICKEVSGEENVIEAIIAEAGWMHDSGIFVESVEVDTQ